MIHQYIQFTKPNFLCNERDKIVIYIEDLCNLQESFKKTEANAETYKAETNKVKSLLKNDSYTELIKFKDKNTNAVVKYLGTDTLMDK